MLKQQTFDIADPKNYRGKKYKYHVGFATSTSTFFGGISGPTLHSAIVIVNLEIQTDEDVRYLQDKLMEVYKTRHNKKPDQLIILGFNLLND